MKLRNSTLWFSCKRQLCKIVFGASGDNCRHTRGSKRYLTYTIYPQAFVPGDQLPITLRDVGKSPLKHRDIVPSSAIHAFLFVPSLIPRTVQPAPILVLESRKSLNIRDEEAITKSLTCYTIVTWCNYNVALLWICKSGLADCKVSPLQTD